MRVGARGSVGTHMPCRDLLCDRVNCNEVQSVTSRLRRVEGGGRGAECEVRHIDGIVNNCQPFLGY